MGEWATVYEDEIEGQLVTLKVYRSDQEADDDDGDDGPAIRVTTTSAEEYPSALEADKDADTLLLERELTKRPITLEPYSLEDLEGELMEVGFSPEAAAQIASKVPV
ncbi:hypothetical protein [Microvirga zambiensis]|uniref:hypothetical protein n=1 Tax=Microvirga zambiensis TaxID=1402137 RepID=UPI00191D2494|nr:hypothetical protein [Microvirga zambiensis]